MDCDAVLLQLAAATGAPTLSGPAGAQLRDHLDACDACRAVAETPPPDHLQWVIGIPADALADRDLLALPVVDPILFAVEAEIAHGGMGRITRVRDRRLGRDVAMKEVLLPHLAARFEREVAITAKLQHPAIVPVYEAGAWPDGAAFYTMRLVSGGTLGEAIGKTRSLEERLALLPHVIALTDALAYAHSRRIVHRDLKPGNVLVGEFGETVVIDWGLAKELDRDDADAPLSVSVAAAAAPAPASAGEPHDTDLTVAGSVLGTPGFMAPEQATGGAIDARADVYALGSILYTLLVGRAPYWDGETTITPQLIDERAAAGSPTPIALLAPRVPVDLQAIAERAMARAAGSRYATAKEMADELRRFAAGQLLRGREYRLRELLARWLRRHRGAVAVAAVALAVVAVLSAIGVGQIVAREDETRAALAQSRLEQGRQLLVGGDPAQAAPYLAAALVRLPDDPIARRLAAASVRDATRHLGSFDGTTAAFRGDGGELAIGRADGAIDLRDPATGALEDTLSPLPGLGGAIAELAYARDGAHVAIASATAAYVRDLRSGALVMIASPRPTTEVRAVPRGFVFAQSAAGSVLLVDGDGAPIAHDELASVAALAVSADGTEIAAVSQAKRGAIVWHTADLSRARVVAAGLTLYAALPETGDVVTAGDDLRVWPDAGSAATLATGTSASLLALGDHRVLADEKIVDTDTDQVRVLARDPVQASAWIDRTHAITGGYHRVLRVWDLERAAQPILALDTEVATTLLAVDASGRRAVSRGAPANAHVELWDIGHLDGPTRGVATGTRIDKIVVDRRDRVAVHLADTATQLRTAALDLIATVRGWPIVFRPKGDELVTDDLGILYVYASRDGALLHEVHGPGMIWEIAFSPDGAQIATSSSTHVTVRDAAWAPTLDFDVPGDDITALALDDHGRVITGHLSGAIRLWDARTGALVSAATEHTATVSSIDFRGETFVTNSWDLTTRLWDAHTGAQRRVLKRFDAGGYDVELSPNGDLLASADGGAVVNLWDRQHGRLLARYPTLAEATQAAFLDDDHLVVGDTAGHAEIFDIAVPPRTPDEIARAVAASRWQLDGSRVSERR